MVDTEDKSPTISSVPSSASKIGNQSTSKQRTLVLCFDGTGEEFDSDNSNVVKFFNLLKRDDRREQMVYYQTGIGTYTSPQPVTSVGQAVSKTLDKMVAWNLNAHVIAGYEFLMQNYETGDKICLFGFSRGAYTARALAGMLHKVGLLPPCNHQQVPFAYKMYTRTDKIGWKHSIAFKEHFSINVDIDFIGVWDTVCSVGIIPRQLPFTESNRAIRVFRHALSLDERRAKFEVNHYHRSHSTVREVASESKWKLWEHIRSIVQTIMHKKGKKRLPEDEMHFDSNTSELKPKTNVKEVWFAGCHSDVGGGSHPNEEKYSLARIPLRWMIREVFRANTGIRFRTELFKEIGLDYDPSQPQAEPRVVEEEEGEDAKSELWDQLSKRPWWWILEVLPSKRRDSKKWWEYTLNLGRGRTVPPVPHTEKFYIHHTVKMREEAVDLKEARRYKPKATWGALQPIYVDEPQPVDTVDAVIHEPTGIPEDGYRGLHGLTMGVGSG